MRFDLAAAAIVAKLETVGLAAAVDPRDLNPPCVWVDLNEIHHERFAAGQWAASWTLTAIAPDTGTATAYQVLGDMAARMLGAFGAISNGTKIGVQLPTGGDPCPAIRFTVELVATDEPPTDTPSTRSDSTPAAPTGVQPNETESTPDDRDSV